jgi:dienelactone hydrolase
MKKWMVIFLSVFFSYSIVQAQDLVYEVDGKRYQGYFISPKKNAPLVLLVHDWDGLTHYEITRANMLAKQGFAVMVADLFGQGIKPTTLKDKREHTGELYQDRVKMRKLLYAALHVAQRKGIQQDNVVAMGYCFGGAAVLELARSGANLKGFVSFHGGLTTPSGQNYSQTKGKVLVFHGTADTMISMDDFARLANELEASKVPNEMTTYGSAPHSFTVFNTPAYRQGADQQSWSRFIQFLRTNLKH